MSGALLLTLEAITSTLIPIVLSNLGICDDTWKPIFHAMSQMNLQAFEMNEISVEDLTQSSSGPLVSFANIGCERPLTFGQDLSETLARNVSSFSPQQIRVLDYLGPAFNEGYLWVCDPPPEEVCITLDRAEDQDDMNYWLAMVRERYRFK